MWIQATVSQACYPLLAVFSKSATDYCAAPGISTVSPGLMPCRARRHAGTCGSKSSSAMDLVRKITTARVRPARFCWCPNLDQLLAARQTGSFSGVQKLSVFQSAETRVSSRLHVVVGKVGSKPLVYAFIEQNSHSVFGREKLVGLVQCANGHLACHGRESLQELFQRLARLQ